MVHRQVCSEFSSLVGRYISGNLYGETWKSLVVKNEDQKEHPKVNWQSSGYRTSKVESDRHKDDYMKELWAAEQAEDSQWNLHKLNRCRDPTVLPPSYAGYIPYVKSENLIGASSGRTLLVVVHRPFADCAENTDCECTGRLEMQGSDASGAFEPPLVLRIQGAGSVVTPL